MLSASFKSRRSRKLFSDQIHKLINAQNDLQAFHIQTQPAVTAQHVWRSVWTLCPYLPAADFHMYPPRHPPLPPAPRHGGRYKAGYAAEIELHWKWIGFKGRNLHMEDFKIKVWKIYSTFAATCSFNFPALDSEMVFISTELNLGKYLQ